MTTPDTHIAHPQVIAEGSDSLINATETLLQEGLGSIRPGSEEAQEFAEQITEAALRLQKLAGGLLELANVAVIPIEEPEEELGANPEKKAKKIKPRYNERQLEVAQRIVERIKPGEEFKQSQLNSEDLEGLTANEKQTIRSFYSSVLAKLYEDGFIGHNGKQRGGSKSVLESAEKLQVLLDAEGYVDEQGTPIPEAERFVVKAKKAKGPTPSNTESSAKPSPAPTPESRAVAHERRIAERKEQRQLTRLIAGSVKWIAKYLETTRVQAPTPKRVGEAVALELGIELEEGVVFVHSLLASGVIYDRTHKGSKIISATPPTEAELAACREKQAKAEAAAEAAQSKYGQYFEGDDVALKERYGEVRGVRRSDINFDRGIIALEGNEKLVLEYFFDTKARSAVAYKQLIADINRKNRTKLNAKSIERAVEVINALAGKEFIALIAPTARRAKDVKGPRVRILGSFMEDSHARY